METLVPYAIYLVLGLVGAGLLAIVLFGVKSLASGKINTSTMILSGIPVVLLVVLGFALGDWSVAGIYTFLISLALTTGALLLSGVRGLFGL